MTIYESKGEAYYLRRFAALQFPCSVENYCMCDPIHLLQQRSSNRDNDKRFWDAYNKGELEGAYYTHADFDGNVFKSLDDLVMQCLEIHNKGDIKRYNDDCAITGNKPFERFVPGEDEFEYLESYGVDIDDVTAWLQSDAWDTMAFGFTHDEVNHQRELLDNHIYEKTRTYAMDSTSFGRYNEEVSSIMDFIYRAGEELLFEELRNYSFRNVRFKTPEKVVERFREFPDSKFTLVSFRVHDKANDIDYEVKVFAAGRMQRKENQELAIIKPGSRYVQVTKTERNVTIVQKFRYPLKYDYTNEFFYCASGNEWITPAQRLFLYTLYKKPISSKKEEDR